MAKQDFLPRAQQIKGMVEELHKTLDGINEGFSAYAAENTDENMQNLFLNDKKAFYTQLLDMQENYMREAIEPMKKQIEQEDERLGFDMQVEDFAAAKQAFDEKYKDAGISSDELFKFYEEQVPDEIKKELEDSNKIPPQDFFEAVYYLYQQANGQQEQAQQAQQPPQHIPSQAPNDGARVENDLPMARP